MANVTFKGNPVTLKGKELTVGDQISVSKYWIRIWRRSDSVTFREEETHQRHSFN